MNPFCRIPVEESKSPKFRSKLPYQLYLNNPGHAQCSYLISQLDKYLLIGNLAKRTDEEQSEYLKTKLPEITFDILLPPQEKLVNEEKNVAILKFKDEKDK